MAAVWSRDDMMPGLRKSFLQIAGRAGAIGQNRTADHLLTMQVLYRLSYDGPHTTLDEQRVEGKRLVGRLGAVKRGIASIDVMARIF